MAGPGCTLKRLGSPLEGERTGGLGEVLGEALGEGLRRPPETGGRPRPCVSGLWIQGLGSCAEGITCSL